MKQLWLSQLRLRVLDWIARHPGTYGRQMQRELEISHRGIYVIMSRLRKSGFVAVTTDTEKNRRLYELTIAGRKVVKGWRLMKSGMTARQVERKAA